MDVGTDQYTNRPEVDFVLDSEGAEIFAKFTAANKGKNLAIVSDNKIKSYARINDAIMKRHRIFRKFFSLHG